MQASPDCPVTLRVLKTVAAGGLAAGAVEAGGATRIMTGGAVPEGADAVVMLEQTADAVLDGLPAVQVKAAAKPGQNIARSGEEFRLGSLLANPGHKFVPGTSLCLVRLAMPAYRYSGVREWRLLRQEPSCFLLQLRLEQEIYAIATVPWLLRWSSKVEVCRFSWDA